ncbi:MAG: hypothetical protein ABJN42_31665 [Roseibium sp.]|uniref:hypothetical protein n=1 Tax=Roseibium sp. TaxID=1936156 RepID=UPI00329A3EAC
MSQFGVITHSEMTRENLRQVILGAATGYEIRGIKTEDIGDGHCENFAFKVLGVWAGQDWMHREWQDGRWGTIETANLMSPEEDGWDYDVIAKRYGAVSDAQRAGLDAIALQGANHVWIEFDGKAYDAEHPNGVDTPFDLKFFQRYLDRVDTPEPM